MRSVFDFILTIVTNGKLSFLWHAEWNWLKELAAQTTGQPLQCGQVLDLQVVRRDVAVLDGATVEFSEEFLEDVVDADASQNVALLNAAVQWLWNKPLVAGGIENKEDLDKHILAAAIRSEQIRLNCIDPTLLTISCGKQNIYNTVRHCNNACRWVCLCVGGLPDIIGRIWHRRGHVIVTDGEHSHAQALVF